MNEVYSEFMAAAGDDQEIPFDDLPPFTGAEWWRAGEPAPPANAQYVDGAVHPNTPYGTSFSADPYNPSGVNYTPWGGRAPYGTQYGSEMSDQLALAIDSDPYAIGQNLGLLGDYMDDSESSWDDSTNISW